MYAIYRVRLVADLGSVLTTRVDGEHGPSRQVVIDNDIVIIFYLQNARDITGYQHGP